MYQVVAPVLRTRIASPLRGREVRKGK